MLSDFRLRYCRARLPAYLNGELSPRARQRIARYLDSDARCYAEYVRQRDLARELMRTLPGVGQPAPGQLDRIWAAVQADTAPAQPVSRRRFPPRRTPFRARYGLAGMGVAVLLAIPVTLLGGGGVSLAVAPQPAPRVEVVASSPEMTGTARVTARAVAPEATPQAQPAELILRATPRAISN